MRPRDPAAETWTGRRAGVEGAVSAFGADAAFPSDALDDKLAEIVAGAEEVHYPFGREPEQDAAVGRLLGRLRAGERRGRRAPVRLCDARLTLHEMRLLKSPEEIAVLRRAAAITAEAHTAAMRAARPGASEREIEALIDYTFRRRGGTGPGYGTIVGAGANATILHYVENASALERGAAPAHRRRLRGRRLHGRRDAHLPGRRALLRAAAPVLRGGAGDAAGGHRDGQAGRDARPDSRRRGGAPLTATWWRWAS